LSAAKKRPALVVAVLADDDVILCQITSRNVADNLAISLTNSDFTSGGVHQNSNIRPNRIFTADSNIILYRAGVLATAKVQEFVAKIFSNYQYMNAGFA